MTVQTGSPSTEWPPTDYGSSGPFIVLHYAIGLRWQNCPRRALAFARLMAVCLLLGFPVYSWEQPTADGFIDGNGSAAALQAITRARQRA